MKIEFGVEFGEMYRDSITGFEGICTGVNSYQNGCRKVLLEPQKLQENGQPVEGLWFDEQRVTSVPTATSGGPMLLPPRI